MGEKKPNQRLFSILLRQLLKKMFCQRANSPVITRLMLWSLNEIQISWSICILWTHFRKTRCEIKCPFLSQHFTLAFLLKKIWGRNSFVTKWNPFLQQFLSKNLADSFFVSTFGGGSPRITWCLGNLAPITSKHLLFESNSRLAVAQTKLSGLNGSELWPYCLRSAALLCCRRYGCFPRKGKVFDAEIVVSVKQKCLVSVWSICGSMWYVRRFDSRG